MQKRILIVDDNARMRDAVRAMFEADHDFSVCEASDGQEAIEKAGQLHPDL